MVPAGANKVVSAEYTGKSSYSMLWDNGAVTAVAVEFSAAKGAEGSFSLSHGVSPLEELSFPPSKGVLQSYVRRIEGKGALRVDRLAGDRLRITHQLSETDLLGNQKRSNSMTEIADPLPGRLTAVAVDGKGHYLYAGTENGMLLRWDVAEPGQTRLLDTLQASGDRKAITSLALVLGDVSIAVGDAGGSLSTWFPVSVAGAGEDKRLTRIHTLRPGHGTVSFIIPSPRDKTLFSGDGREIHADHMTSERDLLTIRPEAEIVHAALSPKGNSLSALDSNRDGFGLETGHPPSRDLVRHTVRQGLV